MSAKRILRFVTLVTATIVVFFGCDLLGMTIQARLEAFAQDLSLGPKAARANTYENFHSTLTQDYLAIQGYDPGTGNYIWDLYFPQTASPYVYSITIVDSADPSNVMTSIDSTAVGIWPKDAKLVMAKEGFGYKIVELWLDVDVSHSIDPGEQIIK